MNKTIDKKTFSVILQNKTQNYHIEKPDEKYPSVWIRNYYKEYPRFPKIILPSKESSGQADLFNLLIKRRSERNFTGKAIDIKTLSKILFFSSGISHVEDDNPNSARRVYPSGGARYPLEVYLIIFKDTQGIPKGIYHYNVKFHSLEQLKKGEFVQEVRQIVGSVSEDTVSKCSVIIAITGVFSRTEIKYSRRAYRFVLLEAGHMAQNIYLVTNALELGCCAIGGFIDRKINKLLSLDANREQVVYLLAVGSTKNSRKKSDR